MDSLSKYYIILLACSCRYPSTKRDSAQAVQLHASAALPFQMKLCSSCQLLCPFKCPPAEYAQSGQACRPWGREPKLDGPRGREPKLDGPRAGRPGAQVGQACRQARRAGRPGAQAGQAPRQARHAAKAGTQAGQETRQAKRPGRPGAQAGQAPRQARRPGRPSVQAGQAPRQARHSGRPGAQVDQAPRQASRPRTENDGEMAAKTMRFVYFAASGAAGIHFGRAAGARRLQKAGLEAPEAPQDSAKRPKGRPLGDQRAPKASPGQPKERPSGSKGWLLEHFGVQNGPKTAFCAKFLAKGDLAKSIVLPKQNQ